MNQEAKLEYLIYNVARRQLPLEEEVELLRLAMLDPVVLDLTETELLLYQMAEHK